MSYELTDEQREADEELGRKVRVERETAEALAQWQSFRDAMHSNPVALAALDLHKPRADEYFAECWHCQEHDGYEGTQQVAWPCGTYARMWAAA